MAVRVFGQMVGGRAKPSPTSPLEDPDPRQLVESWNEEARKKRTSAAPKTGAKAGRSKARSTAGSAETGKTARPSETASAVADRTKRTAAASTTDKKARKPSTPPAAKTGGEQAAAKPPAPPSSPNGGNGRGEDTAYTGDQIQILEGVQHIRQRPGMYIGTTSTAGLLHLVYEAIDNVVDEFNAGYGSQMWITIDRDGRVTVRDEARGIPIDPKEWGGTVLPTATWIFIKPFTGGKFEPGAYKQAGGLHGVGLTVINALSAELEVDVWRDGQHFHQRFRGGEALEYTIERCDPSAHGTQIRWLPDPGIFDEDATYDVETLLSRLEATACLNRGLRIQLTYWDEETRQSIRKVLHSQNGLADYVRTLAAAGAPPLFRHPISIAKV